MGNAALVREKRRPVLELRGKLSTSRPTPTPTPTPTPNPNPNSNPDPNPNPQVSFTSRPLRPWATYPSVACARRRGRTSPVERWPWPPTCCRFTLAVALALALTCCRFTLAVALALALTCCSDPSGTARASPISPLYLRYISPTSHPYLPAGPGIRVGAASPPPFRGHISPSP